MRIRVWFLSGTALTLTACGDIQGSAHESQYIQQLSKGVLAIAAPYQDLKAVKIDPSDGCYVYRHVGPVETTFLPLRTVNGNPICSRAVEKVIAS